MIKFESSDGHVLELEKEVAKLSGLAGSMIDFDIESIPFPNVEYKTLQKVVEFLNYYNKNEALGNLEIPLTSKNLSDNMSEWYVKYIDINQTELETLKLAANYMDIRPLYNLCEAKEDSLTRDD